MRLILSDDCLPESETCVDQSVSIEGKFIFLFILFVIFYWFVGYGTCEKTLYVIKHPHIFVILKILRYIYGVFIYSLNTPNN